MGRVGRVGRVRRVKRVRRTAAGLVVGPLAVARHGPRKVRTAAHHASGATLYVRSRRDQGGALVIVTRAWE